MVVFMLSRRAISTFYTRWVFLGRVCFHVVSHNMQGSLHHFKESTGRIVVPPSERHFQQQRFKTVRKQRYERHLAWYKQLVKRKQTQTNIEQTDGNLEDDTDKCEGYMLEAEEEQKKPGKHPVQEDSSSVISSSSSSGEEDDADDSVISENTKIPTKPLNVDSESKLGEVKAVKKLKTSVKKEDPYKVYEYLQLSLEEAFFLSYGLGCLALKNDKEESMNLTDMWKEFCNQQPTTFLGNYIAYHYYRSKGWVPKLGVKFGAEFILYKKGPPFYHASYSVIIKMVDQRSLESIDGPKERWSRWAGLNRVTETVAKEVLFCYIIKPTTLTDEELMSPKCISSYTIHEVVMKRIVPSRERTNPQLPPEIS
ncbi:uncharacterized protein [Antedon mediterranea]|uniref:uncharacterized protein isoform X2 n=1 Tax=Antedon mediterranea TaxID=105859 RepID=UPI003AF9F7A9